MLQNKNLIVGPCSAESEKQLLTTAVQLKGRVNVDFFRAGIWKPRSSAGGFEGVGEKGLYWLEEVKDITGFKIATEVATALHVEKCLKHNVDLLWIGARTTVSPFNVQEIAEALKGTEVKVLIKNPVSADIKLWAGAYERIKIAGVDDVGFIHRGFSEYNNLEYRNPPIWQIPIEMKRLYPEMEMICDPSHITGNRDGIYLVAQNALNLNFDGLMIETHFDPETALTDNHQQITPVQLCKLIDKLIAKKPFFSDSEYLGIIEQNRRLISNYDEQLINLLSFRMNSALKIGNLKKENNIAIFQKSRWDEILNSTMALAEKNGLDSIFIKNIMELIHVESIRLQELNSNRDVSKEYQNKNTL